MFQRLIVSSAVLSLLGLVACSSPSIEGEGYPSRAPAAKTPSSASGSPTAGNQGTGTGTGTGSGTGSGSGSGSGSGAGTPPATPPDPTGTSTCGASATYDACVQCCAPNPDVLKPADQAFEACACAAGACKTQCGATFCAGNAPDAACETCLGGQAACDTQADAACNADAACKTALDCISSSSCDAKP